MGNPGSERRKSKRTKANFTIIYDVHKSVSMDVSLAGQEVDALMMDLGKEGLAITTNYEIPIASILNMKFTLINRRAQDKNNKSRSIYIMGEVRSSIRLENGEYRLGIHFIQLKDEDAKAIDNFVEAMSSPPKNDEG
ncbi:MAG: PilZ domain-containing protein [Candidatus Omnitrophota bacterium]